MGKALFSQGVNWFNPHIQINQSNVGNYKDINENPSRLKFNSHYGGGAVNRNTNLYRNGKTKGAHKIITKSQKQSQLLRILKARK